MFNAFTKRLIDAGVEYKKIKAAIEAMKMDGFDDATILEKVGALAEYAATTKPQPKPVVPPVPPEVVAEKLDETPPTVSETPRARERATRSR